VVKTLCAKPVGLGERTVEVAQVARIAQRSHLVNHNFRPSVQNGLTERPCVESVNNHRVCSGSPQSVGF
jgi:hypothetical protein